MQIREILDQKKAHLDLLLLADEQENMIDCYLERGSLFVLEDPGRKAVCVVTREGPESYELKNLAVEPSAQRMGYGRKMVEFIWKHYPDCKTLMVGTGASPATLCFYQACGFVPSHRVKHFFRDHYDHPILEDGILLDDMIYLKQTRDL